MKSLQTPAREYFAGIGSAVADRTVNRKILRPLAEPKVVNFSIPRDDAHSLDDQIKALAKSQGYVCDGDYHVEKGDDEMVVGFYWAVAEETREVWADVAKRVALGNTMLHPVRAFEDACAERVIGSDGTTVWLAEGQGHEFDRMHHHLRQASLLMSGRHLQHGDETQPTRPLEVYTNCSSSVMSTIKFMLLLSGSGVGRSYDDALMEIDWRLMPVVVPVIDWSHPDVQSGEISGFLTQRDARHLYVGKKITIFRVPDSREGWAKAVEQMEKMAWEKRRREVLIIDFSDVRERGAPIKGMQNRPASGPAPLMKAIQNVAALRDAGMAPWRSAMYADHYLAECVLVGGARRAARMATKWWKDKSIFGFIGLKRGGFLWSSNNSITIDKEFREHVQKVNAWAENHPGANPLTARNFIGMHVFGFWDRHAWKVMTTALSAAYHDGTGEPGFISVDLLTQNDDGMEVYEDGVFAESSRYKLDPEMAEAGKEILRRIKKMRYRMICNPCGEIALLVLGGYCTLADVVPYHAANDDDAEDAFRTATRALIRTNLMDSLYSKEVRRTNRIGVGFTGLHEWAWSRFKISFHDMITPDFERLFELYPTTNDGLTKAANSSHAPIRAAAFWLTLSRFKRSVADEARRYATELGVTVPHTNTTVKPAGTTSKLFGLSEGAHLPSMREFLRWVQYRDDDPLVAQLEAKGYPVRRLKTYSGTAIVGFPTRLVAASIMGDALVTAPEATPEEQFEYLRLLERYWITGVAADGITPLQESGNQVSYTLKYDPRVISFADFVQTMIKGQFTVRCCSVMPTEDKSAYEYLPEQAVPKIEYEKVLAAIRSDDDVREDVDFAHVDCASGACPVDFSKAA